MCVSHEKQNNFWPDLPHQIERCSFYSRSSLLFRLFKPFLFSYTKNKSFHSVFSRILFSNFFFRSSTNDSTTNFTRRHIKCLNSFFFLFSLHWNSSSLLLYGCFIERDYRIFSNKSDLFFSLGFGNKRESAASTKEVC